MRRPIAAASALFAAGCAAEVRDYVPETGASTVRAGDLDVAYFEDGDGPLVLLLHGFPDTAHTWDDVRPALADAGYHAVSPFMPGYAPTSVDIDDPDSQALGEDVLALLDALGEDSAVVVGHDWGAYAAYAAAYLDPERVSALVTVAIPPPGAVPLSPAILWGARHFLYLAKPSGDDLMRRGDFAHVNELYARWSPTWHVPDAELEPVKNAFAAPGCLDAALGYYRASSLSTPAFEAGDLSMPAMLVGGTDDGILPERAFTGATDRFTQPLRVELLPGGHFVHRESPDAFEAVLLDFLASVAPTELPEETP